MSTKAMDIKTVVATPGDARATGPAASSPMPPRERFDDLVAFCGERAWRLAYAVLGDIHDAEDALQAAFIAAASSIERMPQRDAWPWFAGVVVNAARNERRMRERRRRHQSGEAMQDAARQAIATDPAASAERADLARHALAQLMRLPDDQREALSLTRLSGLTHAEAAQAMGLPLGSLNHCVHQGIETLRRRLDAGGGELNRALGVCPIPVPVGGLTAALSSWGASAGTHLVAAAGAGATHGTAAVATAVTSGARLVSASVLSVAAAIAIALAGLWWILDGAVEEQLLGNRTEGGLEADAPRAARIRVIRSTPHSDVSDSDADVLPPSSGIADSNGVDRTGGDESPNSHWGDELSFDTPSHDGRLAPDETRDEEAATNTAASDSRETDARQDNGLLAESAMRVRGSVINQDGEHLSGITVHAYALYGGELLRRAMRRPPLARAVSDRHGAFAFDLGRPSPQFSPLGEHIEASVIVVAAFAYYRPSVSDACEWRSGETIDVQLLLCPNDQAQVYGTVREYSVKGSRTRGQDVEGATVTLIPLGEDRLPAGMLEGWPFEPIASKSFGDYAFSGLSAGGYWVLAAVDDKEAVRFDPVIEARLGLADGSACEVDLSSHGRTEANLAVSPQGILKVHLKSKASRATVHWRLVAPGIVEHQGVAERPGASFEIPGLRKAFNRLVLTAEGFAPEVVALDPVPGMDATCEVSMEPARGKLNGRVVDDNGRGLAGARIEVRAGGHGALSDTMLMEVLTDARGEFKINGLGERPYIVMASLDGYAPAIEQTGAKQSLGGPLRIVLLRAATLRGHVSIPGHSTQSRAAQDLFARGRVILCAGEPWFIGAKSLATVQDAVDRCVPDLYMTGVDATGRYCFDRVVPGTYTLVAAIGGIYTRIDSVRAAGNDAVQNVDISEGCLLRGVLELPNGVPLSGVQIWLEAGDRGKAPNMASLTQYAATTGEEGRFFIEGVAPGRYRLFVREGNALAEEWDWPVVVVPRSRLHDVVISPAPSLNR